MNFSENGNDIIIQQPIAKEAGSIVYYFSKLNNLGYEQALPAKGDEIYFITWKGSNYMLLTERDKEKKHLNSIDIYNYSGPLIGVLMRMNIYKANIDVSYYSYFINPTGQLPEGAIRWPYN